MILVGEVYTGLLRNSAAVTSGAAAALLDVKGRARPSYGERPVRFAISADHVTGVDCRLASTHVMPRAVGTVRSRATIIGGQILQASSHADIVTGSARHRQSWSHYLSRPGVLELIGAAQPAALGEGFLTAAIPPSTLDLGAINARLAQGIQTGAGVDSRLPFRARPTRLRWIAATAGEAGASVTFGVERDGLRTLRLAGDLTDDSELAALCGDIALHDWLLSTVLRLLEQSQIGELPRREVVTRLAPALDYLLHLWMPGARLSDAAMPIWQALETRPGFTRQWDASVDRIRDQLALASMTRLLHLHPSDRL